MPLRRSLSDTMWTSRRDMRFGSSGPAAGISEDSLRGRESSLDNVEPSFKVEEEYSFGLVLGDSPQQGFMLPLLPLLLLV